MAENSRTDRGAANLYAANEPDGDGASLLDSDLDRLTDGEVEELEDDDQSAVVDLDEAELVLDRSDRTIPCDIVILGVATGDRWRFG